MRKCAAVLLVVLFLSAFPHVPATGIVNEEYPHYIEENAARYEAYRAKNPGIQYDMVIAYVNAGVDLGGYNGITEAKNPGSISVLVNQNFSLPPNYTPRDLVSVGGGFKLRAKAAEQFSKMKDDMNAQGYRIHVMAAYRTYQRQVSKYSNAAKSDGIASADRQFARPGHSEHQTGLAVDILHKTGFKYMTQAAFENTKEYAWLTANAYKYGFILRYPLEYVDIHGFIYEPWHWRYVGVDIATTMYYEGIVMFEEYYGWYLAQVVPAKAEKGTSTRMSSVEVE